jgi:hypothetical protein
MKLGQTIGFACTVVVLVVACAGGPRQTVKRARPPNPPRAPKYQLPSLESHLAGAWIGGATRLQGTDAVIWYRGTAQRESAEVEPWTGTVTGDILFASPQEAMVIPSGTLTLRKKGAIQVIGRHSAFLATPGKPADWAGVLSM